MRKSTVLLAIAGLILALQIIITMGGSVRSLKMQQVKDSQVIEQMRAEKEQTLDGLILAYSEADMQNARNRQLCELLTAAGYEIPVDLLPCDPAPTN